MMVEAMRWSLSELPLYVVTAISAHLVMSGGQTLFHYGLGHRRVGAPFTETISGSTIGTMPEAVWCRPPNPLTTATIRRIS